MFQFIVRRLLLMIPTTLGVALVVFGLYHIAPGDPATVMMGTGGELQQDGDSESRIDTFKRENGLDRSLAIQFLDYIGPFNLGREGHAWFSTPYTERKTEAVEVSDGVVDEGRPLAIGYRPDTDEETAAAVEAAVAVLEDDAALEPAVTQAGLDLVELGERHAVPGLLTSLFEVRLDVEGSAARIDRVGAALTAVTDHTPELHPEREAELGRGALIGTGSPGTTTTADTACRTRAISPGAASWPWTSAARCRPRRTSSARSGSA